MSSAFCRTQSDLDTRQADLLWKNKDKIFLSLSQNFKKPNSLESSCSSLADSADDLDLVDEELQSSGWPDPDLPRNWWTAPDPRQQKKGENAKQPRYGRKTGGKDKSRARKSERSYFAKNKGRSTSHRDRTGDNLTDSESAKFNPKNCISSLQKVESHNDVHKYPTDTELEYFSSKVSNIDSVTDKLYENLKSKWRTVSDRSETLCGDNEVKKTFSEGTTRCLAGQISQRSVSNECLTSVEILGEFERGARVICSSSENNYVTNLQVDFNHKQLDNRLGEGRLFSRKIYVGSSRQHTVVPNPDSPLRNSEFNENVYFITGSSTTRDACLGQKDTCRENKDLLEYNNSAVVGGVPVEYIRTSLVDGFPVEDNTARKKDGFPAELTKACMITQETDEFPSKYSRICEVDGFPLRKSASLTHVSKEHVELQKDVKSRSLPANLPNGDINVINNIVVTDKVKNLRASFKNPRNLRRHSSVIMPYASCVIAKGPRLEVDVKPETLSDLGIYTQPSDGFYLPRDPSAPYAFTQNINNPKPKRIRQRWLLPMFIFCGVLSIVVLILYIGCMTPVMKNGIPR